MNSWRRHCSTLLAIKMKCGPSDDSRFSVPVLLWHFAWFRTSLLQSPSKISVSRSWPILTMISRSLFLSISPSLQALNHDSSKSACQVSWSTMESNVQFPHKNFQHEEDICRFALCTTTTMNRLPCVNDTCHTFWCTGVISDAPALRWLPWKLRQ